jgi:hypothetical protein
MQEIMDTIQNELDHFGIDADIDSCAFTNHSEPKGTGVYVIYDTTNNELIYVGKGIIPVRLKKHYRKLSGTLTEHDPDPPEGWMDLLERQLDYSKFDVIIISMDEYHQCGAIEQALIYRFLPYANYETYLKRKKLGS